MVCNKYSILLHASGVVALRSDDGRPRSCWQRFTGCLPCFGGQRAGHEPLLHDRCDRPRSMTAVDQSWAQAKAEREHKRNAENAERQNIVAELTAKLDAMAAHPMVLHASDGMTLDEVSELYEWLDNANDDEDTSSAIHRVLGMDYKQMLDSMKLGKKLLVAAAKVIDRFVDLGELPFRRDDDYDEDDEHYQFVLYHTQKKDSDNWEKFFGLYKDFRQARGKDLNDLQIQNPIVIDPDFSFFADFQQLLMHIASDECCLMRSSITHKEVLAFQSAMKETWSKYSLQDEGNFEKSYDQYSFALKIVKVIEELTNPETFEGYNPRYEEDRDDMQRKKNRLSKQIAENLEKLRAALPRFEHSRNSSQNPFHAEPPPDRVLEEQVAKIQAKVECAIKSVSSNFYQDTRFDLYQALSKEHKYENEFRKRDREQNGGAVLEQCELALNALYHFEQVQYFNERMDGYWEEQYHAETRLHHRYGVLRDQHYEAFCRSSDDLRSRRGLPRNTASLYQSLPSYTAPPRDPLGLPGNDLERALELDQKLQELATHPNLIDSDILQFFDEYQKSSYLKVDTRFLNLDFEGISCTVVRDDPKYDEIESMLSQLADYKKELSGKSCGEPRGKQFYKEEIEKLQQRFAEVRRKTAELIPKTVHELLTVLVVHGCTDKYLVRRMLTSKQMHNLSFFLQFALERHGQSLRKFNLYESCESGIELLELFKKSMFREDSAARNRVYQQLLAARTELRRNLPEKLLDYKAVCKSFRDVFKRKPEGESLVVGAKVIPYNMVREVCKENDFPWHFDY